MPQDVPIPRAQDVGPPKPQPDDVETRRGSGSRQPVAVSEQPGIGSPGVVSGQPQGPQWAFDARSDVPSRTPEAPGTAPAVRPRGRTRGAVFRRGLVFVLVVVLCFGIGAAAAVLPAKVYTATETLSVEPTGAPQSSGIDLVNFLLPSIIARTGSQTFHDQVRHTVAPQYQTAVVELSATNQLNSGVLNIDAKGRDRVADANWAATAASLIQASENTPASFVSVSVIQGATVPDSPTSPQPAPLLLGSATLGVILGASAVALMARPRPTAIN